jgi:hypothetical protein
MKLLFIFMDGVGLGSDDPQTNPFARAHMPALESLLDGRRLLASTAPFDGKRASLRAIDARLGVDGLPQSATGQSVLLTGLNVPALLGYHYGPKPNRAVAEIVSNGNLFALARRSGLQVDFLNAYPPGYFAAIQSGRRMYAAIALAASSAGLRLHGLDDMRSGRALPADLTGVGLRERLGLTDISDLSAEDAGRRLARLGLAHDFSLFEYWLTDYAGHGQDMDAAVTLLETFDAALGGLLEDWDDSQGLVLVTSDHGNLEDLTTRRHTFNPVPALLIGAEPARLEFARKLHALIDVQPGICETLFAPR